MIELLYNIKVPEGTVFFSYEIVFFMSETAEKILSGDIRAAARLISDIDNNNPDVREILKELYPHTGNALCNRYNRRSGCWKKVRLLTG